MSIGKGADLAEVTYFVCIKTLSEAMSKLPLYLIDREKRRQTSHEISRLIGIEPNAYQTFSQLMAATEYSRNHYGNAYIYVNRDASGKLETLIPLDAWRVQVWIDNTSELTARRYYYMYSDVRGQIYSFKPGEVLHFKNWLTDENLLIGRSTREILATSLKGMKASTAFLNDLYQRGLIARAYVKYIGDLKPTMQEELLNRLEEQARTNSRRMIALPVGFDIQPLDLKLTDSQFSELRQYSALQIAAAFGIKPNFLNDYSKSSYANSSMQNLTFLTDTLLSIVVGYEQELTRKLLTSTEQAAGYRFKFNTNILLRSDPSAQAEIISKLLANGVYTIDEARGLLDREPCTDAIGSEHLINAAYKKLSEVTKNVESKE